MKPEPSKDASCWILVLNAGSSSLKFSLFQVKPDEQFERRLHGQVDGEGKRARLRMSNGNGRPMESREIGGGEARWTQQVLNLITRWLDEHSSGQQLVVGHRVVHGGPTFSQPVRITPQVFSDLEKLIPLAPLHQPGNLAAVDAVRKWRPEVPQIACFDTAFHRTHSKLADLYALPWEFYKEGIRRYGFHGLSYEYVATVLPEIAPELSTGRVVVAHLGSGASLCALHGGQSVDSTMGFSVLDGIPMATRPGSLDAGVLLYLLRHRGYTVKSLEHLLYHESGWFGLSGLTRDMRHLQANPHARARLAVQYFVEHVAKKIAEMAAALKGLDGIVFTAGIGEHSPEIRAMIANACAWLRVELDPTANLRNGPRISFPGSRVSAWVIPTNEELMIATHAWRLVRPAVQPRRHREADLQPAATRIEILC